MFAKMKFAAVLAACIAAASPLHAQAGPGSNVADRFRQQSGPATQEERTEAILTGDTDLVLLRRTPLFTLFGTANLSPTSNAFLSTTGERSDIVLQAQAGLRIGTRIGARFELFAQAALLGVRYVRFDALGYSAFTGAAGASTQVAGFDIALTYQPSIIYSKDFKTRQLTQHQFTATLSRSFSLGHVVVTPGISGQRVQSSPSDYRNWSGAADLSLTYPFRIRAVPAALFATGRYEHRDYDGYFRDLLGVDRRDDLIEGSVGLAVQPARWGALRAAYIFQHNRSTSDVNGYTAHSGALSLSASVRF